LTKTNISFHVHTYKDDIDLPNKSANSPKMDLFINEKCIRDFLQNELGKDIDPEKLKYILEVGILPTYQFEKHSFVLKKDVRALIDSIILCGDKNDEKPRSQKLFEQDTIRINPHTIIDLLNKDSITDPLFYSATKNLISSHNKLISTENNLINKNKCKYLSEASIATLNPKVIEYVKAQLNRAKIIDNTEINKFARSAYYMGSKRALCGFIVEAIASVLPESGVVVDLMCGSGIVSGATNKIWKTYSSDAQEFCRILSVVHGGGFSRNGAKDLLSRILPIAKKHFIELQSLLADEIENEEDVFCREIDDSLLEDYKRFVREFPVLCKPSNTKDWSPTSEVQIRRKDNSIYPYCLFTTYFANVFFGLRQCLEIDSLRYAIDIIKEKKERMWALGALITTTSFLGTTYGGHFAQPPIRNYLALNENNISDILYKRSQSITHEFTARLLNLSEISHSTKNQIETIPGPWESALCTLDTLIYNVPVIVYLDAPYKREEYSRFYHVLETLVEYRYPSCSGIGLTPKPNDRFRSEFFTKTNSRPTATIIDIIIKILNRGWHCAWSYSDNGQADICEVVERVYQKTGCEVISYSAKFVHKSHGGTAQKNVMEYLIILSPKKP